MVKKVIWKKVPKFEKYEVSNYACVRKVSNKYVLKQRIKGGYYTVRFGNKEMRVHRVVALAFLRSPKKDQIYVNHIDGNKFNNNLSNLEWITPTENTKHALKTSLIKSYTRKVYRIDPKTNKILKVFNSIKEVTSILGFTYTTIKRMCEQNKENRGVRLKWDEIKKDINIYDSEEWSQFRDTRYFISSFARIKNETKIIKKTIRDYESIGLVLKRGESPTHFYVHKLVAEVFLPNPENLEQVDHIDKNPLNNNLSNLRWISRKNNTRHGSAVKVDQLDLDGNFIKTWNCIQDAKDIYGDNISACARGVRKTCGGFKWTYTDRSKESNISINKDELQGNINKDKRIDQLDLHHNLIKTWPNIDTIIAELKLKNILKCVTGQQKTCGGFKWLFTRNNNLKPTSPQTPFKSIDQFDLDCNLIKTWPSLKDAKTTLGLVGISSALIGRSKTCGGFKWKYHDINNEVKLVKKPFKGKPIDQLTMTGKYIKTWPSIAIAQRTLKTGSITNCLAGNSKSSEGFKWRYAVEK